MVVAVGAAHMQLDDVPLVAECSVVAQDVASEVETESETATAIATAEGCSEGVDTEAAQEVVQGGDLS